MPAVPSRLFPAAELYRVASAKFLFGIDLRTLALFRVFAGLVILADLFNRALYLRSFYTDFGILPRAAYYEIGGAAAPLTFHAVGGSTLAQALLFAAAALLAIALVFGFFTRTVTVLSWLFLLSLENRNPYVVSASDHLQRMLLFWGMLLPLGARFSIDRSIRPHGYPGANAHCSISSAALLLQTALLYLFTALLKTAPDW